MVVLDGSWDRISPGEDSDAPSRLYYVAMTRAPANPHISALARSPSSAGCPGPRSLDPDRTEPVDLLAAPVELTRPLRRLSLRDVFLSYAGYRGPDHPVHAAIAALAPGDVLQVRADSKRWKLLDRNGTVVGELAGASQGIADMRCTSATVLAVVGWDRESSEPSYQDGLRRDAWEVVVPELVFEPE